MTVFSTLLFTATLASHILAASSVGFIHSKSFKEGDNVEVYMTKVVPFRNVDEEYEYDRLPWPCKPEHAKEAKLTQLGAQSMREGAYSLTYLKDTPTKSVCGKTDLSEKDVSVKRV